MVAAFFAFSVGVRGLSWTPAFNIFNVEAEVAEISPCVDLGTGYLVIFQHAIGFSLETNMMEY